MRLMRRILREESGPTAVEYAVMLALIIVVLISSITLVGGQTMNYWQASSTSLDGALGVSS